MPVPFGRAMATAVAMVAMGAPARAEPPFSASAAALSDTTLALSIVTPIALQVGGGLDEPAPKNLLIYGEALVANGVLNYAFKHLIGRPRPYTLSVDPRIARYTSRQGGDARRSFYSGHSSTAFTAAVAGSLLFESDSEATRAGVWGFNVTLAAVTSGLRVRAGKHHWSDVLVGALVGTGFGVLFPALQTDVPAPTAGEWAAMAGGLAVGFLGSQLFPLRRDILEPLELVSPVAFRGGGGLRLGGTF